MKPIHEVSRENIRHVTVPLSVEQIKEFFVNKELVFLIDYTKSNIKGNMFLTYISNMDLPSEILFLDASKEDRFELLKIYMQTRNLNNSNSLKYAASQIMLHYKGFDTNNFFNDPAFTAEECDAFINENKEMIVKWDTFITSSLLFMLTSLKEVEDEFNFKEQFPVIDDALWLGNNVVQVITVPTFLEFYFSKPPTANVIYFKQQFEEYMFKGKNFFEIFSHKDNLINLTLHTLLSTDIDLNKMSVIFKRD